MTWIRFEYELEMMGCPYSSQVEIEINEFLFGDLTEQNNLKIVMRYFETGVVSVNPYIFNMFLELGFLDKSRL